MNKFCLILFALIAGSTFGMCAPPEAADAGPVLLADVVTSAPSIPQLNIPAPRARMSPELALQTHEQRLQRQAVELGEYNDETVIEAELPSTSQKGRFRLKRAFTAPKSLVFKAVDFVGDGFVKTNVIARLLQSEVDYVEKGQAQSSAISAANYKFNYKGIEGLNGQPVHVFQVKPRKKRAGLFKGKVYLNVYSGSIVRAEGRMVKSPSIFIKKIEFVQDYANVGGFNLVSQVRSTAHTRVIGKAIVNITHSDYQAKSVAQLQSPIRSQQPTVRPVSFPTPY